MMRSLVYANRGCRTRAPLEKCPFPQGKGTSRDRVRVQIYCKEAKTSDADLGAGRSFLLCLIPHRGGGRRALEREARPDRAAKGVQTLVWGAACATMSSTVVPVLADYGTLKNRQAAGCQERRAEN